MSDESNPHFPDESGKTIDDNNPLHTGRFTGGDAGINHDDGAAERAFGPGQAQEPADEDDVEIVFYAAIDTPQGEQIIAPDITADPWVDDKIKILLPAWSDTTISSRAAAPPLAPIEQKSQKPIWRGCIIGAVAAAIVFSLLGSSFVSIYWFWNLRSERAAEEAAMFNPHSGLPAAAADDSRPAHDDEGQRDQPLAPALAPAAHERVDRIVFVNNNRQIETINPDGSDERQLTSDAKSYLFPAWSEDGRNIAAIGTTIHGAGIYVMPDEEESGANKEVHFSSDDSPFYLYWAPDGRQITFLANSRAAVLSLNVVDVAGENASRMIARGSPMYWNWSADSRQMLVHSGSGTNDSQLMMVDDFGRPQAPRVPAPGPFQAPGISASGRYWAYSQFQAGGTTWLVIDDRIDGAENSGRHAGSVAFNWSPTKDELAFISGDAGNVFSSWGPLRLMDAETGDIRLLSDGTILAFFWSPDGRKIATISVPERNDFGEQFEVRNEKGRRLTRYASERTPLPAAQTAAHSFAITVIDVQSGEGLELIETGLSAVFLSQFLPYFDQYAFSHHIWSPDSNSLVLPLDEGRQSHIAIVDTRNGRTTPLVPGSIGFWSPN